MSAPAWVFAYGSNMELDDLARWLGERGYPQLVPIAMEPGMLPGYRLCWNYRSPARKGGAANVEPCDGPPLPGLALAVDAALLEAIDHKEGHPERYKRELLPVMLASGRRIEAWVYRVTEDWRVEGEPVWPRGAYLELLLKGARHHGLPDWHIAALEEVPRAE